MICERFGRLDYGRRTWQGLSQWATTINLPTAVHSNHNEGASTATFLFVQDDGIYYSTRAMGFEFADR